MHTYIYTQNYMTKLQVILNKIYQIKKTVGINENEWKRMKMSGNEWKMNKYERLNEWIWIKMGKKSESEGESERWWIEVIDSVRRW